MFLQVQMRLICATTQAITTAIIVIGMTCWSYQAEWFIIGIIHHNL